MARRRGRKSSRSSGMGARAIFPVGGFIGAALIGMGVAAGAKRFVGAPLGGFTGAAAGFAVGGIPGAIGGYIHDNLGNVGGASSTQTTELRG